MKSRRRFAGLAMAAVTVFTGVSIASTPAASAATVNRAVGQAADFASQHGVRAGIAVLDTKTGKLWSAGCSTCRFPTASVVKTYMYTYLAKTGKLYGYNAQEAWIMITRSDNNAMQYLLNTYFGGLAARLVSWIQQHYPGPRMGAGPYPSKAGCWGNTHITSRGLVRFYRRVERDPQVGPKLLHAMHNYNPTPYGFNQVFGIPQADPKPDGAIKQGWSSGCSPEYPYSTVLNSTGFVNNNRYTVAILTESNYSIAGMKPLISRMAEMILPHGKVSMP